MTSHSRASLRISSGRRAWYTSATKSYWSRVCVLAESVRRWHPQDDFVLIAVDHSQDPWDHTLESEFITATVTSAHVGRETGFRSQDSLDIVELCTAIKGAAMALLLDVGYGEIGYLDPDTAVFSPLRGLIDNAAHGDVVLVPHQLSPDSQDWAIRENEVSSLKHGVFNFGTLMVKSSSESRNFVDWWTDRLSRYCLNAPCDGLFTDQKWGNLVPIFFPTTAICRDPGVNVASWNLRERQIELTPYGAFLVSLRIRPDEKSPLQLYHFTKAGSVGEFVTARHASPSVAVASLWRWYLSAISSETS